jgi:F-box and WD-40 domain protein MET30
MSTFVGHTGAVTRLALGEDKIVSGSDDGDVRIWSFCVRVC